MPACMYAYMLGNQLQPKNKQTANSFQQASNTLDEPSTLQAGYSPVYCPAYPPGGGGAGGPRDGFPYKKLKVNREFENQRKPPKPQVDL